MKSIEELEVVLPIEGQRFQTKTLVCGIKHLGETKDQDWYCKSQRFLVIEDNDVKCLSCECKHCFGNDVESLAHALRENILKML